MIADILVYTISKSGTLFNFGNFLTGFVSRELTFQKIMKMFSTTTSVIKYIWTASQVVETDQPTVDLGAKTDASPTASQRGACAGRIGPNTDCTSYPSPPHAGRRAAPDGVRTPHASHRGTATPAVVTDQPTVDEKERRSTTVSQTYYNSVHDQFPSNSLNSKHHTVHRAPCQDNASHRHPRTSKQGKSQHNKVSSYFNCKSKSDQSLNTIPPVGYTVTSTNNSTSLDTVVVSDASHPDRLNSSVGHGIDDHSHDLHSGHPRQDHTSDTTDNNPLDTSDKILNTAHPIQASPNLRIFKSLTDHGPDHEIDESNSLPGDDLDGVDTRNLEFRDLSVDPSTNISDRAQNPTAPDSGINGPVRDMGVSADTWATYNVTRKQVRDASMSPDTTH